MGTEQVLRRARRDIEQGDLGMARLRLESSLWGGGAEVRALLVDVCHRQGDPAAAGRFGYVTDLVDDRDLAAFARRHGNRPALMLRAIGWGRSNRESLPDAGRARLEELERRWHEEPPVEGIPPLAAYAPYMLPSSALGDSIIGTLLGAAVIAMLTIAVFGVWKAVEIVGALL